MFWDVPKSAIVINRNYNNLKLNEEYIVRTDKQIREIILHVKENPEVYERNRAAKDNLSGIPKLTLQVGDFGMIPENPDVQILGKINFKYSTPVIEKKMGFFKRLFLGLSILIAALFVVNGWFLSDLAAKERVQETCKLLRVDGVPTEMTIYGTKYKFDSQGNPILSEEDKLFLNPTDRAILSDYSKCDLVINTTNN